MKLHPLPILLGLALGLAPGSAWAGSYWQDPTSTCTSTNCKSQKLRGVFQKNEPFVIQLFASAGQCLRIEVTRQSADMEMALVSPNPSLVPTGVNFIFADDDSGVGLLPLIKVDPTSNTGWYTLVVSRFSPGSGGANFDVRYGRYPTGNPNCSPSSLPGSEFFPEAEEVK